MHEGVIPIHLSIYLSISIPSNKRVTSLTSLNNRGIDPKCIYAEGLAATKVQRGLHKSLLNLNFLLRKVAKLGSVFVEP